MSLQVLVELGKRLEGSEGSEDLIPYPREALREILIACFTTPGEQQAEALDELLHKTLTSFGDVRFEAYSILPGILREVGSGERVEGVAGRVIRHLGALDVEENFRKTLVVLPASVTKKSAIKNRTGHRSAYTSCWLDLLRLIPTQSVALHKRILAVLDDTVIPSMTRPQLLMDYLTDAYNAGGIISLLALSSLFTLIRTHNLDYPEFYPKLYSLLDNRILHISYRRRFLRLLDLFMQSTMMPAGIIAAFAKRVSRLALWAPAASGQWVVPFVYNLMKMHPTCRVMIHRKGVESLETDPYRADDPNPATCQALESSLWEMQTLTRHHWGTVARQAAIFSERFTKPPMDLAKVLDGAPFTYEEIIGAELEHRWSKRPPTDLDIPAEAFD